MQPLSIIVGATITLVALYLFVANSDGADRVIRSLSSGYVESVKALQGR